METYYVCKKVELSLAQFKCEEAESSCKQYKENIAADEKITPFLCGVGNTEDEAMEKLEEKIAAKSIFESDEGWQCRCLIWEGKKEAYHNPNVFKKFILAIRQITG